MKAVLTAKEMKARDAAEIERGTPSLTLMERAANAALDVLFEEFDTTKVLFLCGGGNNGGDGFAMARLAAEKIGTVDVCYTGECNGDGTPNTAKMSAECAAEYALLPPRVRLCQTPAFSDYTALVDAMLGIGISRPVTGDLADIIARVNASRLPVLAVDIPSGVCADTGEILGCAIAARHTVAMAVYKYGHLLFPAAALCGKITVADIGIPTENAVGSLLERSDLSSLPARPRRAHKGTFGRVLVIGGSHGMSGAAHLAAKAAYRTGAGLVEILAPEENRLIHQSALPEALVTTYNEESDLEAIVKKSAASADAVAIGMGLSRGEHTAKLVGAVLTHARVPLVIDADALNEISDSPTLAALLTAYEGEKILTPHLGEMSRLAALPLPKIASNLPLAAANTAERFAATVVLKDAHTVVCDGTHLYLNTYGNSGMATGGAGDVLAGVIAALAASGDTLAAPHGVLAHALAGDVAAEKVGSHGLMASDIIDALCHVLF